MVYSDCLIQKKGWNFMRKLKALFSVFFICCSILFVYGGNKSSSLPAEPDYSKKKCWLHVDKDISKKYDVFYVHPTTYMNDKDGMIASLDNKTVNERTQSTFDRQVTAFAKSCNIFAPRYRQSSIKVLAMSDKEREKYLSVGLGDVVKALKYYLENYNKGRPYILASHSQGSQVMRNLLLKYGSMIDKKKLIAVYAIGYTITADDLKKMDLPLAVSKDQLGGLITWNTIGKDGKSPVLEAGALCVNPLSWNADKTDQPASKNIYARILLEDGKYLKIPNFTSASIDDKGGLVIPTPKIIKQLSMGMGPEVYHGYDYDFFYGNLEENVAVRCKAWLDKNKK
jgi:hypothetical protein